MLSTTLKNMTGSKSLLIFGGSGNCKNLSRRFANTVCNSATNTEDQENHTEDQENQERDFENFPRPERAEIPGKVRFGFIPDEWFNFFYNKTGITGPYVLALSTGSFLLSKEIYVLEHNFFTGISTAIATTFGVKTLGPHVAAYADKKIEKAEKKLKELHIEIITMYENAIANEKREQWRAEGQLILLDAKRQSVAVQLETDYRKRLIGAYCEVKQHLDREVELDRVMRNVRHRHMVMWVSHQVGEITDNSSFDELFLKQCIDQLQSIAPLRQHTSQSGGSGPMSAIPFIPCSNSWLTNLFMHYAVFRQYHHCQIQLLLRQKAKRVFPLTMLYV